MFPPHLYEIRVTNKVTVKIDSETFHCKIIIKEKTFDPRLKDLPPKDYKFYFLLSSSPVQRPKKRYKKFDINLLMKYFLYKAFLCFN